MPTTTVWPEKRVFEREIRRVHTAYPRCTSGRAQYDEFILWVKRRSRFEVKLAVWVPGFRGCQRCLLRHAPSSAPTTDSPSPKAIKQVHCYFSPVKHHTSTDSRAAAMENTGHSVSLCGLGGNRHLGLQEGVSLVRALGVGMRQTEARATKSNAARHNALSLFIFLILIIH